MKTLAHVWTIMANFIRVCTCLTPTQQTPPLNQTHSPFIMTSRKVRCLFFTVFVVTSVLIVLCYLKSDETVLYTVTFPQDLAILNDSQLKKVSPDHPTHRKKLWVDLQPNENMLVRKIVLQYVHRI